MLSEWWMVKNEPVGKWWIACQVGREAEMAIDETILVPRMHRISSKWKNILLLFNGKLSKKLEWVKNRGCSGNKRVSRGKNLSN